MKIAVFYNLAFGGAKRVVFEHVRGLVKRGHTVDLYTTDLEKDIFDPSLKAHAAYRYPFDNETIHLPMINRFVADYQNFFRLKNLHKQIALDIDSRNYDLVLAHPDRLTQAPFLLRFLRTPSIYYCQEPLRIAYEFGLRLTENVGFLKRIYEETTRLIRKHIDRDNVRSATLTLASCLHIRERMIEAYDVFPKVSYLGVDDKVFRPLRVRKENKVFFVGSMTQTIDGYDLVEKALKLIPPSIRPKLQVLSWTKNNRERFSEKDLVLLYNQSMVTLCMSRFETFGLVPLESMACGAPVIATNVSGHRETVLNNKTGFLVDFEPKEIAEKMKKIIQKPLLASELGKSAREHIEMVWSWEKRLDEFEALLKKFLKEKKR